jgi:hypothetical protein
MTSSYEMQFFKYFFTNDNFPADDIWRYEKLYRLKVSSTDIARSNWIYSGNIEVPDHEKIPGKYVICPVGTDEATCYQGNHSHSIDKSACSGLEVYAMWSAGHLRECLDSDRQGKVSVFNKSLRERSNLPL